MVTWAAPEAPWAGLWAQGPWHIPRASRLLSLTTTETQGSGRPRGAALSFLWVLGGQAFYSAKARGLRPGEW